VLRIWQPDAALNFNVVTQYHIDIACMVLIEKVDFILAHLDAIIGQALWEQVQALLKKNRVARKHGTHTHHPSLLVGLLYDDQGNRMTPTHAVKDGKRYRYYISQRSSPGPGRRRPPGGACQPVILNTW
jgi:hypothetical protein